MEASPVDQQHLEASKRTSARLEASDSVRTVDIAFISDKNIIPAAVAQPRQFSGSIRCQFASMLASHFLACTDPESGAALPGRPPNAPRFRGVTKHKRTQRYEAHIWESKKQIYLGGFDSEILAAKSHDIMAIRCKGANCEILNYGVSNYEDMLPLIERLSREDIISALRNYSKAQTALRLGPNATSSTPSGGRIQPFPMPSLPAIRAGGVYKPGNGMKGGLSTPRRSSGTATGALPLLQQHRRQRQRHRSTLDVSLSEEEDEEDIDIDSEATEDADMDAGADSDGDYLYHHTPRSQGSSRRLYGNSGNGGGSGTMLPPMPHSAPPLSQQRTRRRGRSGQCPGAKISPRIATSGSIGGGFHHAGSGTGGGVSPFAWSAPSSPHTPQARVGSGTTLVGSGTVTVAGRKRNSTAGADVAAEQYDDLDLNFVLSSLVDESSLTYSANDESYLFESMPVDANHTALVHLSGVELFQNSASMSPPDSPVQHTPQSSSGELGGNGGGGVTGGTPLAGNIIITGINQGFLPGTPLPPTATAGGFGRLGSGGGAVGAGAGTASPQTPPTGAAGVVHQHGQIQIPPIIYQSSLPFTSPFADAF